MKPTRGLTSGTGKVGRPSGSAKVDSNAGNSLPRNIVSNVSRLPVRREMRYDMRDTLGVGPTIAMSGGLISSTSRGRSYPQTDGHNPKSVAAQERGEFGKSSYFPDEDSEITADHADKGYLANGRANLLPVHGRQWSDTNRNARHEDEHSSKDKANTAAVQPTRMKKGVQDVVSGIRFPQNRKVLWDRRPVEPPFRVELVEYLPIIIVQEDALVSLVSALRTQIGRKNSLIKNPFHGYFKLSQSDLRSESPILQRIRADSSITLSATDFLKEDEKEMQGSVNAEGLADTMVPVCDRTNVQEVLQASYRLFQSHCESGNTTSLETIFPVTFGVTLSLEMELAVKATLQVPSVNLTFVQVPEIRLTTSLLTRTLQGGGPGDGMHSGFVTIDSARKLVPLMESDSMSSNCPLVGVWIWGVGTAAHGPLRHPYVLATCLRFLASPRIRERVFISSDEGRNGKADDRSQKGAFNPKLPLGPSRTFLIMLCGPKNSYTDPELVFYECTLRTNYKASQTEAGHRIHKSELHQSVSNKLALFRSPAVFDFAATLDVRKLLTKHAGSSKNNRRQSSSGAAQEYLVCRFKPEVASSPTLDSSAVARPFAKEDERSHQQKQKRVEAIDFDEEKTPMPRTRAVPAPAKAPAPRNSDVTPQSVPLALRQKGLGDVEKVADVLHNDSRSSKSPSPTSSHHSQSTRKSTDLSEGPHGVYDLPTRNANVHTQQNSHNDTEDSIDDKISHKSSHSSHKRAHEPLSMRRQAKERLHQSLASSKLSSDSDRSLSAGSNDERFSQRDDSLASSRSSRISSTRKNSRQERVRHTQSRRRRKSSTRAAGRAEEPVPFGYHEIIASQQAQLLSIQRQLAELHILMAQNKASNTASPTRQIKPASPTSTLVQSEAINSAPQYRVITARTSPEAHGVSVATNTSLYVANPQSTNRGHVSTELRNASTNTTFLVPNEKKSREIAINTTFVFDPPSHQRPISKALPPTLTDSAIGEDKVENIGANGEDDEHVSESKNRTAATKVAIAKMETSAGDGSDTEMDRVKHQSVPDAEIDTAEVSSSVPPPRSESSHTEEDSDGSHDIKQPLQTPYIAKQKISREQQPGRSKPESSPAYSTEEPSPEDLINHPQRRTSTPELDSRPRKRSSNVETPPPQAFYVSSKHASVPSIPEVPRIQYIEDSDITAATDMDDELSRIEDKYLSMLTFADDDEIARYIRKRRMKASSKKKSSSHRSQELKAAYKTIDDSMVSDSDSTFFVPSQAETKSSSSRATSQQESISESKRLLSSLESRQ